VPAFEPRTIRQCDGLIASSSNLSASSEMIKHGAVIADACKASNVRARD
jgi:hypothetical protein